MMMPTNCLTTRRGERTTSTSCPRISSKMSSWNLLPMHRLVLMSLILLLTIAGMSSPVSAAGKDHHHMNANNNLPGGGTGMTMGQDRSLYSQSPEVTDCLRTRKWWAFLLSSLGTFVIGVFVILAFRAMAFLLRSARSGRTSVAATSSHPSSTPFSVIDHNKQQQAANTRPSNSLMMVNGGKGGDSFSQQQQQQQQPVLGPDGQPIKDTSWASEAKDWAGELISGQTTTGRILVVLVFLLSIASLVIYFIDASRIGPTGDAVEKCSKWSDSPTQQLDLGLNVFFAVYFCIRFVAAADKLWFMLELYSFVDYFTIPPSFVSLYLNRTWIGLRFLRALRLMSFPDILQYLNVLKTSSSIRLAQLISIVVSVWLTAAGIIHLVCCLLSLFSLSLYLCVCLMAVCNP